MPPLSHLNFNTTVKFSLHFDKLLPIVFSESDIYLYVYLQTTNISGYKSHVYFALLSSFQRICQNHRHYVTFNNMLGYTVGRYQPSTQTQAGGPASAATYLVYSHPPSKSVGHFLIPQPKNSPCYGGGGQVKIFSCTKMKQNVNGNWRTLG